MLKLTAALSLLLITLIPKAQAQCDGSFTVSTSQLTVTCTPNVTGNMIYHQWYAFNMGTSTTNFVYTAPANGTYVIMHILIDTLGHCRDTVYQNVTLANTTCNANFLIIRDWSGVDRYLLTSTSVTGTGNINSYQWIVDGIVKGNADTTTVTLPSGTHSVCLKITTSAGCSDDTCYQMTNSAPPNCSFNAGLSYTTYSFQPDKAYFGQTPNNPNYIYKWEFGDGASATGMNPTHVYNLPANPNGTTWLMKLTITDPSVPCVKEVPFFIFMQPTCSFDIVGTPDDDTSSLFHFSQPPNYIKQGGTWTIASLNDTSQKTVINGPLNDFLFTQAGSYLVCYQGTSWANCAVNVCDTVQVTMPSPRAAAAQETIVSVPNPAQSFAEFNCRLDQSGPVSISVYSGNGVALKTMRVAGVQGNNKFRIPVSQLPIGQYFVDIQANSQRFKGLFQKL